MKSAETFKKVALKTESFIYEIVTPFKNYADGCRA